LDKEEVTLFVIPDDDIGELCNYKVLFVQ
jgi:hypothetical protein